MENSKSADDLAYEFKMASSAALQGDIEAQQAVNYMLRHNLIDIHVVNEMQEKQEQAEDLVQPGAVCMEGRFCIIALQPKKPDGSRVFFS